MNSLGGGKKLTHDKDIDHELLDLLYIVSLEAV